MQRREGEREGQNKGVLPTGAGRSRGGEVDAARSRGVRRAAVRGAE